MKPRNPYAAHLRNKPCAVIPSAKHRKIKRAQRKEETERELAEQRFLMWKDDGEPEPFT